MLQPGAVQLTHAPTLCLHTSHAYVHAKMRDDKSEDGQPWGWRERDNLPIAIYLWVLYQYRQLVDAFQHP
jgi:hypothetical protein